ncbi:MAG: uroporphyrinogen-III synthase, partial [Geobacteraceae bacterium]
TAAALAAHGIRADMTPKDYKAEGVVAAFQDMEITGQRILFPRADRAREVIPAGLGALGADVVAPVAYCNVVPDSLPLKVIKALEEGRIHCVTFTSSSTASNLADLLGENRLLRLLEGVAVAAIGPVTARTCLELGLTVAIESKEHTLPALINEIVRYFSVTK